jgi:glutathione S-transferase
MKRVLSATFCLWLSGATAFTTNPKVVKSEPRTSSYNADTALMATLYGHPGTRSPLVNWGAYEVGVELTMGDLSKNPHPFGQIPCLTDDDDVLVFESGAILHYLHDKTKESLNKADAALVTSWITWANASLDPICFLETPDGKVYDTGLKQPNKRIDQLNNMLEKQSFLIGDQFSLADVAVASYLLYVLQFFRDTDLSRWPNIVRYMKDCASRPAYGQAFGENVQANMVDQLESDPKKKVFGMFLSTVVSTVVLQSNSEEIERISFVQQEVTSKSFKKASTKIYWTLGWTLSPT